MSADKQPVDKKLSKKEIKELKEKYETFLVEYEFQKLQEKYLQEKMMRGEI